MTMTAPIHEEPVRCDLIHARNRSPNDAFDVTGVPLLVAGVAFGVALPRVAVELAMPAFGMINDQ